MRRMKASSLFDLTGRTALVTGASGGLGARFAHVLSAHGAKVALVARRKSELALQVAAIAAEGGEAIAIEADITDRAALSRAFDEAEKAFGTVDLLVANAGMAPASKLIDETEETWHKVMALNLDAVLFSSQEAARRLIAVGKHGAIVVVGSILGFGVSRGVGAYCTSKAAVHQLTKSLALELAPKNIRVNALAPGYIVTDINRAYLESPAGETMKAAIPMRRFGRIDELDGPLLLLASDAGSLMTGTILTADGGHLLPL
jgi:3-oxoacyl-[acyl-carrier protein] reductase